MQNFNLLDVQNALGYVFKNAELIQTAFVHKSYDKAETENNLRLVFLGEKLLNLLVADYVCSHSSAKGEKQLINDFDSYLKALAPEKFIKEHSLSKYILVSTLNEPLRDSAALAREIFYAISAAIYKDGGLPALKGFLMPMMRSLGSNEHYAPSIEGKVVSRAEAVIAEEKHISSAKIRLGAKPSAISVSKAETVKNATDEPLQKAEKSKNTLSKLLKKKDKAQKSTPEVSESEETPIIESQTQKRFIRDPFAPVRLSDDLRNFKPKKPPKTYEKTPDTAKPEVEKPVFDTKKLDEPVLDENYKSLLQELIQKNIRTASVTIKYDVKPISKNDWSATVTLSGKQIGCGKGESKKTAEKAAAAVAYSAIKNDKSNEHKWFASLCTGESTVVDAPSTDYVSKINQYFQKTKHLSSAPVTYEKRPSGQKNVYLIAVMYEGKEIAAGKAQNPKEAKQNAARVACEVLKIK